MVVVYRFSDGTYLEDQDMWFLSGIHREVYLHCQPKTNIFDFFTYSTLDKDYRDGVVNLEVDIANDSLERDFILDVYLNPYKEKERSLVQSYSLSVDSGYSKHNLSFNVENPKKWSAEYPNLYELTLVLRETNDEELEVKSTRIGFRTIEVKNEKILINGQPIMLKGVNRHDFDPDNGWAVPKDRYYQDLYIMKQNNINAIRTSHYPNAAIFYELYRH